MKKYFVLKVPSKAFLFFKMLPSFFSLHTAVSENYAVTSLLEMGCLYSTQQFQDGMFVQQ